jgi:hypothetical protein
MGSHVRRTKRLALWLAGIVSLALAFALVYCFAPTSWADLSTPHLLGVLGLFLLPGATWAAVHSDVR